MKTKKKKIIAFAILALVYAFPFRWAFLEYPETTNVNGTMVDSGRMQYIVYLLLTVFGVLTFMLMTMSDGEKHQTTEQK